MISILTEEQIKMITLISIMLAAGSFGGYLNYLHNFDTDENLLNEPHKISKNKIKYVLLGICSAFLVPAFLNMISSDLIKSQKDPYNYLIFTGFCLIASIFSRRFITTIGERILETAKKAIVKVEDNNQRLKDVQKEFASVNASTTDQIEVVKLAVKAQNKINNEFAPQNSNLKNELLILSRSYIEKTSVPDYSQRVKLKSELGRKMGEIIITNQVNLTDLLNEEPSEAINVAISYAIQIKPSSEYLIVLNEVAKRATQLYTKYSLIVTYCSMFRYGLISNQDKKIVLEIIETFQKDADPPLRKKIEEAKKLFNIL